MSGPYTTFGPQRCAKCGKTHYIGDCPPPPRQGRVTIERYKPRKLLEVIDTSKGPNMPSDPLNPEDRALSDLIELARNHVMSPEERRTQRVNMIAGEMGVTAEEVIRVLPELAPCGCTEGRESRPSGGVELAPEVSAWLEGKAERLRIAAGKLREEADEAAAISARDPAWEWMSKQPAERRAKADEFERIAKGLGSLLSPSVGAETPEWRPDREAVEKLLRAVIAEARHAPTLRAEREVAAKHVDSILSLVPSQGTGEPKVFLDCDGVLADFDSYAHAYFGMNPREYEKQVGSAQFWRELEDKGDFYRNLPLMPDAMALYEGVKHLKPTILTGCPRGDWAQGQKVAWAAEHFPGVPIITCRSADKRDYAKPGDVLIDDWAQHRHRWIEMGGVFITHHCAETSLAALFAHYPQLASAPAQPGGGE